MAVHIDGKTTVLGTTPGEREIARIAAWLERNGAEGVLATDHLAALIGEGGYAEAAGLLALPISRRPRNYILWFLPELAGTVTWAGNPEKPVDGARDERLAPRKSFAAWRKTVSGKSRPWAGVEVEAANLLRTTILDVALQQADASLRETEKARVQQNLLMAELDQRSKNTIATIQSLVRLSSQSADTLSDFTLALERRLQSLAKAHNLLLASRWESASILGIVRDEFSAQHGLAAGAVRYEGLDYALKPQTGLTFALVLHELVTNAMQHGSLSIPSGRVALTCREAMERGRHWLMFDWIERDGPAVAPPRQFGLAGRCSSASSR